MAAQAAFAALDSVPDRGKRAFDGIGRSDALPMLGREVVECQQFLSVLDREIAESW